MIILPDREDRRPERQLAGRLSLHLGRMRIVSRVLYTLIAHKHDTATANGLIKAGYPAVERLLPYMLEWIQDSNWPVARALIPFFASIGVAAANEIRRVFTTTDDEWKASCLLVLDQAGSELIRELAPELEAIAADATPGEIASEVDKQARELLSRISGAGAT